MSAGKATALSREKFDAISPSRRPDSEALAVAVRAAAIVNRSARRRSRARSSRADRRSGSVNEPSHSAPAELPSGGKTTGWVVVVHPLTQGRGDTARRWAHGHTVPTPNRPDHRGSRTGSMDLNDLWLLDAKPYNVSRNHCEILVDNMGPQVCDRGITSAVSLTTCKSAGGPSRICPARHWGKRPRARGRMSPYQFRVTASRV